ncbi:hypothetical protein [Lacihabitans soyangensis]|uniref:Uncharacterized protein n=1 Tax=Lacihabitans soyangensis TaxID=869394 RepID=A0AAE3KUN9_9BACT|nr:hypothetical protein [Lacihabitans soyangensis]MCP9765144.1 hypothetical protein [Lacihabitans soyangensis]
MLKNYRIVDEDSHKNAGAIIPGFGLVPLDAEVLTDDMAKAAIAAKSPFFEEVQEKTQKTARLTGTNNDSQTA